MSDSVSVTRKIRAAPDVLWSMVADLPRMGEWSPENTGGRWLRGATAAGPGVRFRGSNRNGSKSWNMLVTIVDADPGRRISWRTSSLGVPSAEWIYEFEPTDDGCLVTETWIDRRYRWSLPVSAWLSGVKERGPHTQEGIERTLENLASAAEGQETS